MVGVPGMFQDGRKRWLGWAAGEWRLAGGEGRFCWAGGHCKHSVCKMAQLHPSLNSTVNSLFRPLGITLYSHRGGNHSNAASCRLGESFKKGVNCVSCP